MNVAQLPMIVDNTVISDLEELLLDFMAMRGLTIKSLEAMRTRINMFLVWCESKEYTKISDLSSDVFRSYVRYLYERDRMDRPGQKMQHSTIARYIIVLKRLSELLLDRKWAYEDYSTGIVLPKSKYKTIQSFTPEQTQLIFDTLITSKIGSVSKIQTALILYVILDCGLRISEVLSLKPIDVNPSARLVKVLGKGEKERLSL
ncbi:Tyrosine recombinase XerD [compost metagenome]